jgi:hypothetical protein
MLRTISAISAAIMMSACVSIPPEPMNVVERVKVTNRAIHAGQCAGSFASITTDLENAGDRRAQSTSAYADDMREASRADFDALFQYPEFAAKHYDTNLTIGMRQVRDELNDGRTLDEIMYVVGKRCAGETGLKVWDYGLDIDAVG